MKKLVLFGFLMFAGLFYVRAQNPNDVEGCTSNISSPMTSSLVH